MTHHTSSDPATQWNAPKQARSKAKVDAILAAARRLAVEKGFANLKVTEIAKAAKVSVGSLYQYFPTMTSLISVLYEREIGAVEAVFLGEVEPAKTIDELSASLARVILGLDRLLESDPFLGEVFFGASMDPALEAADIENTKKNGAYLAQKIQSIAPKPFDPVRTEQTALLICYLAAPVNRLASRMESPEREALLRNYSDMIARQLESLT